MTTYTSLSSSPALLLGEFDALHGPRIFAGTQFYVHQTLHTSSSAVFASPGDLLDPSSMIVGSHVATGYVRSCHYDALRSIAVRALATSDGTAGEDVVLWSEPPPATSSCTSQSVHTPPTGRVAVGGSGFGSITFHVGDIIARGEKRKFCLVAFHPNHDVLVARWPVILATLQSQVYQWRQAAQRRVAVEYTTLPNLPALREEGRIRGLRSLFDVVCCREACDEGGSSIEESSGDTLPSRATSLQDFHVFAEVLLVKVFGVRRRALTWAAATKMSGGDVLPPGAAAGSMANNQRDRLSREACVARSTCTSSATWGSQLVQEVSPSWTVLTDGPVPHVGALKGSLPVPPLAHLLREVLAGEFGVRATFEKKTGLLLKALLSGCQIIVSSQRGDNANVAADVSEQWALSLAQFLPRSLRKVATRSDHYREGYQSRILAFSASFLEDTSIVQHRDWDLHNQLVLSELQAQGAVHVCVTGNGLDVVDGDGPLITVDDVDTIIAAAGSSHYVVTASGAREPLPTPVAMILRLVEASCLRLPPRDTTRCGVEKLRQEVSTLQAQLSLVLQAHIGKGRIYTRRFQAQEQLRNSEVLGIDMTGLSRKVVASVSTGHTKGEGAGGGIMQKLSSIFRSKSGKPSSSCVSQHNVVAHSDQLLGATATTSVITTDDYSPAYSRHNSALSMTSNARLDGSAGVDAGGDAGGSPWGGPLDLFAVHAHDHHVLLFLGACKSMHDCN